MSVETSIVVKFQDAAAAASNSPVSIELDGDHPNNQDSDGNAKTTFDVADEPVFLLAFDSSVYALNSIDSSSGGISTIASDVSKTRTDSISFTESGEEHSLSYPNTSGLSVTWWGNSCDPTLSNNVVTAGDGTFPCVGEAEYTASFNKQYKLTPPALSLAADEEYQILIVATLGSV